MLQVLFYLLRNLHTDGFLRFRRRAANVWSQNHVL